MPGGLSMGSDVRGLADPRGLDGEGQRRGRTRMGGGVHRYQRLFLFGRDAFRARLGIDDAQGPQFLAAVDESGTGIEAAASGAGWVWGL